MRQRILTTSAVVMALVFAIPVQAQTGNLIELPVLAAVPYNNLGAFEILLLEWDKSPEPNPPLLQWMQGGVRFGKAHLGAMAQAFDYAVERTPAVQHTGIVSVIGVTYRPTGTDGPSAGASMAIGFIAMFKGDHVQRGTALTGTIEPGGQIGWVGGIPDKIRAAKREGCHTVLVPRGQIHTAQWNLNELGFQLNIVVKEVDNIDEAYEIMTGSRI